MDVLLDARLGRKITGIGYYTVELAQELGRLAPSEVRPIVHWHHRRKFRAMGLRPWSHYPGKLHVDRLPAADVIHGTNFHALAHPSARRVATIHDLGYLHLPECHPPGMSEQLDQLVRESLGHTSVFVCDSQATCDDFIHHYDVPSEHCRVVYLGVSPRFADRVEPQTIESVTSRLGVQHPYLLHVGAMVPRKDLTTLLQAFEIVAGEAPDVSLVLAGNKTLRWASSWPAMETWLAARPQLTERIHVVDYVRPEWLPALYQGAAVNVATPLWEGFGLTVLEAFASGTPVVTSNISSLPEVGVDIARYGTPREPLSYAVAILETLASLDDDESRITRGRERAAEFTWAMTARQTFAAYHDAASM